MKEHNKLVRDLIIEMIEKHGDSATWHIANDTEFREAAYEKLLEEAKEVATDRNKGEVADLLEIMYAICAFENWDMKEIEQIRLEKLKERGGFDQRIILDTTE